MGKNKITSATEQRKFTLVYNDFLESKLLNYYEKMIFISLKKFADNETLKAFPSLKTLNEITGISRGQLQKSIEAMKEKGVISVEHRATKEKGHQSNIYTLYDYREVWNAGSSEEVINLIDEMKEKNLVAMLEAKGYIITKKESLEESTDQSNFPQNSLENSYLITTNDTLTESKSQGAKAFTREMINEIYDFNLLVNDYPTSKDSYNAIFELILELLNTNSKTIRVNKEDKSTEIVKSRLLKLNYSHIKYVVEEVGKQTDIIKNKRAYLITSLFNAYTTMDTHFTNLVQHDMYRGKETD